MHLFTFVPLSTDLSNNYALHNQSLFPQNLFDFTVITTHSVLLLQNSVSTMPYLLIYDASVLSLPKDFAKKVDKIVSDFVWEGKPTKLKKPR